MKTGLFIAGLVQLAAAQPHRNLHHQHLHEKRDVVTEYDIVTATAPNVIVYVDGNGNPVSTHYANAPAPTAEAYSAPAPVVASTATPAAVKAPAPVEEKKSQAPVQVSSAAPAASYTPASSSGSASGLGIAYSPYTSSGDCKSASQVLTDFETLAGKGYSMVRSYGTDCNQVETISAACKAHGMKMYAGIFDLSDVVSEVSLIIQGMKSDWSMIEAVTIGNELVNSGQASAPEVVAAIGVARTALKLAGYNGKVATVDTFNALIANPSLCEASDFAAANAHAFYDPDVTASQAGSWAKSTMEQVKAACGGKETIITESGWPSAGTPNGEAVPSQANQEAAISSLKSAFSSGGIILFSAFNDLWKTNTAATFMAEQSYGIYGNCPSSG